ncbi:MAG: citramalate synthase [Herpetosiphonaceae bacterium]|nr:citramalate synthase [Herpetosiphonaceae bacterium]
MTIQIYDTTLRDGTQREGMSLSVEDKLKIARELDRFGIPFIEGGWPGSNPKDAEFFQRAKSEPWQQAAICAFGSTRRPGSEAANDANLKALIAAETLVCTLVGKSWTLHVTDVLETTLTENLAMIADSITYLRAQGRRVFYDAEHFFDGYRADPAYALATLHAAAEAGAECIILCDTNGGALPGFIGEVVRVVHSELLDDATQPLALKLGIHTHNDGELAVANSLAGIEAGATQVQGTINGYGERCGNANLVPIIANLQLKLGYDVLPPEKLRSLTELARFVAAIANLAPDDHAAYVGHSAFAHKGGIHVAAIAKVESSYQHVDPTIVGNVRRVVVSELSGRVNMRLRAAELGVGVEVGEQALLQKVKQMESRGFQYEAAEGSFELLIRRAAPDYAPPFTMLDAMVVVEQRDGRPMLSEATVKLRVNGEVVHTAAEGNGPVNALDRAMRKALLPAFPQLASVHLVDYKVRILDEQAATEATTRVLLEAAQGDVRWSTIGCATNIIEASWQALVDSLELPLLRAQERTTLQSDELRQPVVVG